MGGFVADKARGGPWWISPAATLVAVNAIPLLGAIFLGWSLFEIVLLYWFENVVIGAINILKLATCMPDEEHLLLSEHVKSQGGAGKALAAMHAAKLFLIPFFTFHYGMFCFVHGAFVFALLARPEGGMRSGVSPDSLLEMVGKVLSGGTLVAALALTASHLYSYIFHFLIGGEYRRTNVVVLMFAPYGRIVVLHLAILAGAFAIMFLGQPLILLLLLIGGKTLLDWRLHVYSHRQ